MGKIADSRKTDKNLTRNLPELSESELLLRRLLWEHHGCDSKYLYGDDGELQCHNQIHSWPFGIDFRRDTAQQIEWKLGNDLLHSIMPYPKESKDD